MSDLGAGTQGVVALGGEPEGGQTTPPFVPIVPPAPPFCVCTGRFLGYVLTVPLSDERDAVLAHLLLKRVEIYTWLDSPAKRAHLAAINRLIEEHSREVAAA